MRQAVIDKAYGYLIADGEISLFAVLGYLTDQGITANETEVNEIGAMVNDILLELSLVRSLKLLHDTKRFNQLVYGC